MTRQKEKETFFLSPVNSAQIEKEKERERVQFIARRLVHKLTWYEIFFEKFVILITISQQQTARKTFSQSGQTCLENFSRCLVSLIF